MNFIECVCTAQQATLRSARDFAKKLHVHTAHLARAIKTVTGNTTSEQIAERLTAEAKALLKHTDWAISEISYSLRFEEPAHFSKPFRKHAQVMPAAWRG